KYDLSLSVTTSAQGISGQLVYNTDLFDESTISRMRGHLQNLLEAIVSDPNQDISALALTNEQEHQQLVYGFNEWSREFAGNSLIHETIERQAQIRPRARAVNCEGETLTYAELNRRANQLAHYLIRLGVSPETPVAVYLQPSLDMVISL